MRSRKNWSKKGSKKEGEQTRTYCSQRLQRFFQPMLGNQGGFQLLRNGHRFHTLRKGQERVKMLEAALWELPSIACVQDVPWFCSFRILFILHLLLWLGQVSAFYRTKNSLPLVIIWIEKVLVQLGRRRKIKFYWLQITFLAGNEIWGGTRTVKYIPESESQWL